jgi:hypothetical protein
MRKKEVKAEDIIKWAVKTAVPQDGDSIYNEGLLKLHQTLKRCKSGFHHSRVEKGFVKGGWDKGLFVEAKWSIEGVLCRSPAYDIKNREYYMPSEELNEKHEKSKAKKYAAQIVGVEGVGIPYGYTKVTSSERISAITQRNPIGELHPTTTSNNLPNPPQVPAPVVPTTQEPAPVVPSTPEEPVPVVQKNSVKEMGRYVMMEIGGGLYDVGYGYYSLARHPIQSAQNLANAVTHPLEFLHELYEQGTQHPLRFGTTLLVNAGVGVAMGKLLGGTMPGGGGGGGGGGAVKRASSVGLKRSIPRPVVQVPPPVPAALSATTTTVNTTTAVTTATVGTAQTQCEVIHEKGAEEKCHTCSFSHMILEPDDEAYDSSDEIYGDDEYDEYETSSQ